jgi:hypothetical protein
LVSSIASTFHVPSTSISARVVEREGASCCFLAGRLTVQNKPTNQALTHKISSAFACTSLRFAVLPPMGTSVVTIVLVCRTGSARVVLQHTSVHSPRVGGRSN